MASRNLHFARELFDPQVCFAFIEAVTINELHEGLMLWACVTQQNAHRRQYTPTINGFPVSHAMRSTFNVWRTTENPISLRRLDEVLTEFGIPFFDFELWCSEHSLDPWIERSSFIAA